MIEDLCLKNFDGLFNRLTLRPIYSEKWETNKIKRKALYQTFSQASKNPVVAQNSP